MHLQQNLWDFLFLSIKTTVEIPTAEKDLGVTRWILQFHSSIATFHIVQKVRKKLETLPRDHQQEHADGRFALDNNLFQRLVDWLDSVVRLIDKISAM